MSSFATNFQGLKLHSSPAQLQKLLNLEKLSYYLRMQKQKLKEFRVCTNISCSNILEKEQYCENSKGQCAHVYTVPVFKGAVTLGNFSCNLSRNFVATQVVRCDTGCFKRVTLGNVSLSFWKVS